MQGLQNLGNTCSINTLIQCIGHCNPLREWLLSEQSHRIQNKQENVLYLSSETARVVHEMWVEKKSLAPIRFLKTLYSAFEGMLQQGEQLDLSELWMLMVDKINSEVGTHTNYPEIEGNPQDIETFVTSWKKYNEKCMSMWLQTVQGWTVTRIQCNHCMHEVKMFEPFSSLGLDIHGSQGSFHGMFNTMFQKEELPERSCDHCSKLSSATRYTNICMYPKVLSIYLKRFEVTPTGHARKIGDPVEIPLRLRFSGTQNTTYTLSSIGNHVGNLQGGHYYAIARNEDQTWTTYDDIQISPIEDISLVLKNNRESYMLFYEMDS